MKQEKTVKRKKKTKMEGDGRRTSKFIVKLPGKKRVEKGKKKTFGTKKKAPATKTKRPEQERKRQTSHSKRKGYGKK